MNSDKSSRFGNLEDICIRRSGHKGRGLFFGIMGLVFEIIFLFVWISLATSDPELLFLIFTLLNSEMLPFLFILFVFGVGCLLIALREFGWEELIVIKSNLVLDTPGIRKKIQFFRWSRATDILKDRIITLRLHTVLFDQIGMNKSYQIEVDYQETSDSVIETIVVYKEHIDTFHEPAHRLVIRIHEILALANDIEKTESRTI